MKVILAGSSKTGTKSMAAALRELGYNVYDNLEHILYHFYDWKIIFEGKSAPNHFKAMYENVDAVVDYPAFLYWKEIHKVFPDAKVEVCCRPTVCVMLKCWQWLFCRQPYFTLIIYFSVKCL